MKQSFIVHLDEFNKYLIYGLSKTNEKAICKSCILAVSDLIINLGESYTNCIEQVMNKIIGISNDQNSDKELKYISLVVFTDCSLYIREKSLKYIEDIMNVIIFGIEFCVIANSANVIY